jgi:hypothetical protein
MLLHISEHYCSYAESFTQRRRFYKTIFSHMAAYVGRLTVKIQTKSATKNLSNMYIAAHVAAE